MSVRRIVAIVCIFIIACGGWLILGASTAMRSNTFSSRLGEKVESLWGQRLVQKAPSICVKIPGSERVRWIMPSENDIRVKLTLNYRKKGLIWYPTYICTFDGNYTVVNNDKVTQKALFHFTFPTPKGTYDEFGIHLDDDRLSTAIDVYDGVREIIELAPGESRRFRIHYTTRGLGAWRYHPAPDTGRVQNLCLTVTSDFTDIDYPEGSLSPTSAVSGNSGMVMTWLATDLITKQDIGVTVPEKLNPGPVTSRITFFAPVCLIFFFVLIAAINIVYRVNIHPMHYLFVAAGFFAFHLLLAYLVDHINIHLAFIICSMISVGLVTSYLRGALGEMFPWKFAISGQIFFLVLFSYSFFLKGITGLTVAIGSVLTLAFLMKVTASTNWDEMFSGPKVFAPPVEPLPGFSPAP